MGLVYFSTEHFTALICMVKMSPWSCQMNRYWPSYGQKKSRKNFFQMWPIMPSTFPLRLQVNNYRLNVCKTSCNSSTNFAYFNSWQKVDGETSIVKFGHHSWAYSKRLTKFWGSSVYSSPPYSTYCTLKICTLDFKPLLHPIWIWLGGINNRSTEHMRCLTTESDCQMDSIAYSI